MTIKKFEPGRGYTQADWDEVSDSPEVTAEMVAEMKPFAEVFPELAATIKAPGHVPHATERPARARRGSSGKKRA